PAECDRSQNNVRGLVDKVSTRVYQSTRLVRRLNHVHTSSQRFAKCRSRGGLTAWYLRNENGRPFGVPRTHARKVPASDDLIQNLVSKTVAIGHELAPAAKGKLIRILEQQRLRHFVTGHTVGFHL